MRWIYCPSYFSYSFPRQVPRIDSKISTNTSSIWSIGSILLSWKSERAKEPPRRLGGAHALWVWVSWTSTGNKNPVHRFGIYSSALRLAASQLDTELQLTQSYLQERMSFYIFQIYRFQNSQLENKHKIIHQNGFPCSTFSFKICFVTMAYGEESTMRRHDFPTSKNGKMLAEENMALRHHIAIF